MTEAIITGVVAIVVCVINNAIQHRSNKQQHDTTIALIDYKLDQLTHKVELHNNAVERLYKVEQDVILHDEKIKVVNHRLEDLESK
jgi:hypothetical protein